MRLPGLDPAALEKLARRVSPNGSGLWGLGLEEIPILKAIS